MNRTFFFLLSFLSGLLLSLPWIGGSGLVLLFALVPLLYIENYFARNKLAFTPVVFWMYAFGVMLFWNAFTTWWIWHATPTGALFAIIANAFLMSLVWLLYHYAHRLKGAGFANVFIIFGWLSLEYLHFKWEMAWPWLTLGNGFASNIKIIQWYEFTGVFGGSLWILLVNIMLWQIINTFINRIPRPVIGRVLLFVVIVVAPMIYSNHRFKTYTEKDNPVNVVVVQPNIDPYNDKFSGMPRAKQYDRLLSLADSVSNNNVDFYIGPETSLHEVWQNKIDYEPEVRLIRNFLKANQSDAAFITGAMTFRKYKNKEESSSSRYSTDSTFIYDAFNSALMIASDSPVEMYHKSKLVSGVETMPFENIFGFMDNFVVNLGGTTGSLGTDNEIVVFEHNGVPAGVPICYESVFGAYLTGFVAKGAEVLFVITNDGWWKDSPGYGQHFSFAKIQAISLRRSIARSANTGISGLINQKGEVIEKTTWWTQDALHGTLNRNDSLTFYAKTGDFIARISLFMFVLMLLSFFVASFKMKNDSIV
ncbi:MAG: apolipoprotein N-acyltransferase [Prolixibacteraceae bacterium]|jgi:apolipoprotein N-acyltransferase|nr:apolipoprotein N-acyltransferase [Prolixibacteraceae bacterium]